MMEHSEVTQKIIGCAMKVHGTLGTGFLESVYQNALALELRKAGMKVECEKRIQVTYDGVVVGDFVADMLVNDHVLIENKAVQVLATAHEVQLVNYLTATGINIGLLLNFGAERLEFKRKTRIYRPKKAGQDEQDFQDKAQAPFASYPVHPVNPVEARENNNES
ncbi:MAG TPA: GxxExxY protein [Gallionella sp.]|nr:GxxExxY protein [Gallionella sp.]